MDCGAEPWSLRRAHPTPDDPRGTNTEVVLTTEKAGEGLAYTQPNERRKKPADSF